MGPGRGRRGAPHVGELVGGGAAKTRRYELGQQLGSIARHLLLMTATPHAGSEENFQAFLALLDPDRFEGQYRAGVHSTDSTGLMRRMVKEELLTFEGKPLFPERIAETVPYQLSAGERELYEAVTHYVRTEMNRADSLEDSPRKRTVGFALTVLQRRLASSTHAILRSLERRRDRLTAKRADMLDPTRPAQPSIPTIGSPSGSSKTSTPTNSTPKKPKSSRRTLSIWPPPPEPLRSCRSRSTFWSI